MGVDVREASVRVPRLDMGRGDGEGGRAEEMNWMFSTRRSK